MFVLIATLVVRERENFTRLLPSMVASLIVVQLVLSLSELLLRLPAIWPRPDGVDILSHRPNYLIPGLPGRTLGSIAGPIPLGCLAAVGVVVALWMILERNDKRYWLALGASGALLASSGTRSAAAAAILVVIVWLLVRKSPYALAVRLVTVLAGTALLLRVNPLEALGIVDSSSVSVVHRLGVFQSVSYLLTEQPLQQLLFGNGPLSGLLLSYGPLATGTGVTVFDNQYVRALAFSGIIGAVLLIVAMAAALLAARGPARLVIGVIAIMSLSFDSLTWNAIAVLLILMTAVAGTVPPMTTGLDANTALNPRAGMRRELALSSNDGHVTR